MLLHASKVCSNEIDIEFGVVIDSVGGYLIFTLGASSRGAESQQMNLSRNRKQTWFEYCAREAMQWQSAASALAPLTFSLWFGETLATCLLG